MTVEFKILIGSLAATAILLGSASLASASQSREYCDSEIEDGIKWHRDPAQASVEDLEFMWEKLFVHFEIANEQCIRGRRPEWIPLVVAQRWADAIHQRYAPPQAPDILIEICEGCSGAHGTAYPQSSTIHIDPTALNGGELVRMTTVIHEVAHLMEYWHWQTSGHGERFMSVLMFLYREHVESSSYLRAACFWSSYVGISLHPDNCLKGQEQGG